MKQALDFRFVVGSVVGLLTGLGAASASAEDVSGRDIAASVQTFYGKTSGLKARFVQVYVNKLYNKTYRSSGDVTFLKPGKMRWDYGKPKGKTIATDGKRLVMYEPRTEDEPAQCITQPMGKHQLPQAFSFLTGTGNLARDFHLRKLAVKDARVGFALELRPKEDNPRYERLIFYVAPQKGGTPSGVVRRVLILDAAGNRNRFDFSKVTWNPKVKKSAFGFKPPKSVRCVTP